MSNEYKIKDNKNHTHRHHHKSRGHAYHSQVKRKGSNAYNNITREKMLYALKRTVFCIIFLSLIVFLVISVFKNSDTDTQFKLFENNATEEEVIELKNKIVKYEYYIEELEEKLSKYEYVKSIFEEQE